MRYLSILLPFIPLISLASCETVDDIMNYDDKNRDVGDLLTIMNNDSTNICITSNQYDIINISLFMKLYSISYLQRAAKY